MTFNSSTCPTALPLIRSSAWFGTPDLVTDRLEPLEILSLKLPSGKSKCLAGQRQEQLLGKAFGVPLKIGTHVRGVGEITSISHHVICKPKAVNKPLPLVEAVRTALGLLLNHQGAAINNPTFVFGNCAHTFAERRRSATGAIHQRRPQRHSACRLATVRWT
jgi:hypothetical protein